MNIITNVIVAAGYAGVTTIRVYGMGQTIAEPRYISDGDGFLGNIPSGGGFSYSVGVPTTGVMFVASKNGPAIFSTFENTGTSSGFTELDYFDNGATHPLIGVPVVSPTPMGASKLTQSIFPMRPATVYATNDAAGQRYVVSLNQ